MNIYCRLLDDQTQLRVRRESKAIRDILRLIYNGEYNLCGSFILTKENVTNKSLEVQNHVKTLFTLCSVNISYNPEIETIAKEIVGNSNTKPYDDLHLVCAVYANCEYFITCDDKFIKTVNTNRDKLTSIIGLIRLLNPVEFDGKEMEKDANE